MHFRYTIKLGSTDRCCQQPETSAAWSPLMTSQVEGNPGSWGGWAIVEHLHEPESVRGGWRLRQGYRSPSGFYLLFYFHLVVQVMSAGISLGQGSMEADFLVIKRDGWGTRGKLLVKICTGGKRFQHWKLKSQSSSGDLRSSSHDFFAPNDCQSLFRGSVLSVLRDCNTLRT